jgi:hypothetical protein
MFVIITTQIALLIFEIMGGGGERGETGGGDDRGRGRYM